MGLHRHQAERAGEHFDLRLGDPSTGRAHSWALRKGLPGPGERRLAVQQPTHTLAYMDFKGPISEGYGKGNVELAQRDKTEVLRSGDNEVRFNVYRGKENQEFALRRMKSAGNWFIQNVTPSRNTGPAQKLPSSKPKYKLVAPEKLDPDDPNTEMQAKLDGAHVLYQFKEPGSTPRVFSYRPTERATGIIDHTQKLEGFGKLRTPKALANTTLRGELYAVDEQGKALPAARVGGILNAGVWKSREKQKQEGRLVPAVFDVVQHQGKNVEEQPYAEKKRILSAATRAAPWLQRPRTATTPDEKRRLIADIQEGREPSTDEGVVVWHKDKPVPAKSKFQEERDVYVRRIFAEAGEKRRGTMAGGFEYSTTPKGPIVGRIGTGLSHAMKKDMLENPSKYEGLHARAKALKTPKGYAPRNPVFKSFHLDQDIPEDAKTAMKKTAGAATEFVAGVDPFGVLSGRLGQEAEREQASAARHYRARALGAAGGMVGSGLMVPSVVSGIVQGAQAAGGGGGGVRQRLARGAAGFAQGFQRPVRGLADAARTTKFLGRAARTPGGSTATAGELAAIQRTLKETPLGALAPHVAGAKATPEATGEAGQRMLQALQRYKATGKLHLSPEEAAKFHGQAKGETAKFMAGLGLGGAVGAGGAVAQYEKGRSAEKGMQQRLEEKKAAVRGYYKGQPASPSTVKFKTEYQGIPIHVDRPRGFIMMGEDDKGNSWKRRYKYDYGFIPKTLGGDGDGLDVFIGPQKKAEHAYWAVQKKSDGSFDEYKVFLGFDSRDEAAAVYRKHIPKKLLAGLLTMRVEMMKAMLGGQEPAERMQKAAMAFGFVDELQKLAKIKTELEPHQRRVVERMKKQPGLVVAHGLGSGKTLSSIAAQDALGLPSTVIVPASLKANYEKEREKHIVGTSPEAALSTLQRIARAGEAPASPMMIIDEAHRAREIGTKTYKALKNNIAEKRMLLTASPFYNRPSDIAPLVNIAAGDQVLPGDPQAFKQKYIRERTIKPGLINRIRGVKPGVVAELNPWQKKDLSKVLREWVDYHPNNQEGYPQVQRETVEVPMTSKQLKLYDGLIGQAPPWVAMKVKAGLPPSKQESKDLNAFMSAVRQVSLSTRAHAPKEPPQEPKIDMAFTRMHQGLEGNPRFKGLVYSNYLESGIKPYRERLERAGIPYGEFTGDMKKKERDQMVRDYNEGRKKVLLVSSAGGEGLDLQGTRLIQMMEPHWNAEKLRQVEGRGIRFKSHEHLPKNEQSVKVESYLATRPRAGILEKIRLKKPGGGADEYLTTLSGQKEQLIEQFRGLMKEDAA